MIHNGIIENFRDLRDGLEARGHTLTSETDTEAIAHLVEEAYQGDLADAVRATLRQLEGAYALVVMHKREQSRLVGARKDVPLVVGLHGEESFIASDVAAILAHTNRIIFLEEGDVADVRPTSVEITGVDGVLAPPRGDAGRLVARGRREGRLRALHAQGDPRAAGGAPPVAGGTGDAPTATSTRPRSRGSRTAFRAGHPGGDRRLRDRVLRGARGRRGDPGLDRAAGPGHGRAPSSATRRRRSIPGALVIAVTQSGETADTIAPTRWAREQGCPIVAVTNTMGSAITREADAVMFLQAGPGDRGRGVEDVRHPGHDADRARRGDREGARDAWTRRRSSSSGRALRALPDAAARTLDGEPGDRRGRPPLRQLAGLHVHRPRLHAAGGARGRAEAQGDQLHPRGGLRRGRAQARPDLAARRRVPAGLDRHHARRPTTS